eukprot:jgi/Botrbrau1/11362/Bobra.0038s0111.2
MTFLQARTRSFSSSSFLIDHVSGIRPKARSLPGSLDDMAVVPDVMPPIPDAENGPGSYPIHRTSKSHIPRNGSISSFSNFLVPSNRSSLAPLLFWTCVLLSATAALTFLFPARSHTSATVRMGEKEASRIQTGGSSQQTAAKDTLIMYTYSDSDPEYQKNLEFFVKHGMWEDDPCDYLIIVQQEVGDPKGFEGLPQLPPNARYIGHENRCFDWGTFGWAFSSGTASTYGYKYFIFMNSSIRGPFLPSYWPISVHWSRIFVSRLTDDVKLVGSTISCETAYLKGDSSQKSKHHPHVQSYIAATDQEGLKVLRDQGNVFQCYDDIWDTIWHSEVGSSGAILEAGYKIDCLMLRYQGTNWTDTKNWDCNAGLNPYAEFSYDGTALNPFEVLFIKVKSFTLDGQWSAPKQALKYAQWMDDEKSPGIVNSNNYLAEKFVLRLPRMLMMVMRGRSCFDFKFYQKRSRDLQGLPREKLWPHFVHDGQFEGRPFRFTCPNPLTDATAARKAFDIITDALKMMADHVLMKGKLHATKDSEETKEADADAAAGEIVNTAQ